MKERKKKTPRRKNALYTLPRITAVAYQISEHRDGLGQLGNFVARNPQNLPQSKNKKARREISVKNDDNTALRNTLTL
jgi:hypothetical protein